MRMFVDRLWPEAANISALAEVVALDSETEGPATCDVTPVQPSRGRPKGSGLHKADEPFVQVMRQMVESGKVTGVTDAARRLAEFAAGGGTIESKAERLCDRYRRMYGPET